MNNIFYRVFLGNTLINWMIAAGILISGVLLLRVVKFFIIKALRKWSLKTSNNVDDFILSVVENSLIPFLYFLCFFIGLHWLVLPEKVLSVSNVLMLFATTFYVLKAVTSLLEYFIVSFLNTREDGETKKKQARGLLIILKAIIWVLGLVFLLDNLGYDITTIVAGLGIGGIAVALAAQTILGDLFSYFVILFDRPFEIGDYISIGEKAGVVEYIGIKTTRLRNLSGEQVICSNKDLTDSRLHNFKRMERRRISFNLGVTYQTDADLLESIPGMVEQVITSKSGVQFDRGHFSGFGDSSLNFQFIYFVLSADYLTYMNKQQEIYFEIYRLFESKGLSFAYPTQTLFLTAERSNNFPININ